MTTALYLITRASRPGFSGSLEFYFDDGKIRDQFKVRGQLAGDSFANKDPENLLIRKNVETGMSVISKGLVAGFYGCLELKFNDGSLVPGFVVEASIRTKKRSGGEMTRGELDNSLVPIFNG